MEFLLLFLLLLANCRGEYFMHMQLGMSHSDIGLKLGNKLSD